MGVSVVRYEGAESIGVWILDHGKHSSCTIPPDALDSNSIRKNHNLKDHLASFVSYFQLVLVESSIPQRRGSRLPFIFGDLGYELSILAPNLG